MDLQVCADREHIETVKINQKVLAFRWQRDRKIEGNVQNMGGGGVI
jgi:hypothetical protein